DVAHKAGALLIFDEITIGWRTCLGGAHLRLGVEPDIAVFAKALGNGHPISAVIGTAAAMDGAEKSFISSTTWTESVGPVAALTTLRLMRDTKVWEHVQAIGSQIQSLWRSKAIKHEIPITVPDTYPCLAHFVIDHPEANALKTIFTQELLERGYLAGAAIYPTLAHTEQIVDSYGEAVDEVFALMAEILEENTVDATLKGPPAHQGFQRLL
ncbi:MAG TPA: aminotransferase class III-fold pyridoxal phosphate-dependent enzyme, partial [Candidatus Hydrogenedentes bacterium]|nr:aminotransferase class III-fold pyridoxal phosphate-dependent enzyme [Candidatus Hydrogenedentota bacterium]